MPVPGDRVAGARNLHRRKWMRPTLNHPSRHARITGVSTPPVMASAVGSGQAAEKFRITAAFLGLVVYMWVIHSYKAPIAAMAIGLGVAGIFFQPHRLRLPAPLIWFGAFIVWATLTMPMAQDPTLTWDALNSYSKLWLIFLVACNVAHTRRELYILIVAWLGIYALYPVRGTFFNFMIGHQYWGRYAWNFTFENPNDLAAITLLIFAMSVAVLQGNREKGWIRLSALAGVVALPFLILLTQSRGGILALATMGLLILVQYRKKFAGLAVGALVVGVVAMAAPEGVWERLGGLSKATSTTTLSDVDEEGSAEQRFQIWRVSRAIISDYPVTGVGLNGYAPVHRLYARSTNFETISRGRRDAHSLYLTIMAETGVVGFILFMAMIGSVFVGGRRVARQLAATDPVASQQMRTLLVGLIGFLQACIFASLHAVAFLYLYLGVLATAIVVLGPAAASVAAARGVQRSGPRASAVRPHVAATSRG